jgi:hypothetical protein
MLSSNFNSGGNTSLITNHVVDIRNVADRITTKKPNFFFARKVNKYANEEPSDCVKKTSVINAKNGPTRLEKFG